MAPTKKPAAAVQSGAQVDNGVVSTLSETNVPKKLSPAEALTPRQSRAAVQTGDGEVISAALEKKAMKRPASAFVSTQEQSTAIVPPSVQYDGEVASAVKEAKAMKKPAAVVLLPPEEKSTESLLPKKVRQASKKTKVMSTPSKKVQLPRAQTGARVDASEYSAVVALHPDSFRKRPMSPVFAFINEKRDEIAALLGAKHLPQISKKGTELFKALSPAEQEERQKRFDDEMKAYKDWQNTDEGRAVMMAKRDALANKRAAKKEKMQRRRGVGPFAAASAKKRKANNGPTTPPKMRRVATELEKEGAEKRLNKIHARLRKDVLGAVTSRERALAIAREAIAKGTIKPSWVRASGSTPKSEQPLDEPVNPNGQN